MPLPSPGRASSAARIDSLPTQVIRQIIEETDVDSEPFESASLRWVLSLGLISKRWLEPCRAVALQKIVLTATDWRDRPDVAGQLYEADCYALGRLFMTVPDRTRHLRSVTLDLDFESGGTDRRTEVAAVFDFLSLHATGLTQLFIILQQPHTEPWIVTALRRLRLRKLIIRSDGVAEELLAAVLDGPSSHTLQSLIVYDYDPDRIASVGVLHGRSLAGLASLAISTWRTGLLRTISCPSFDLVAPSLSSLRLTADLLIWLAQHSPLVTQITSVEILFGVLLPEDPALDVDLSAYSAARSIRTGQEPRSVSARFLTRLPLSLDLLQLTAALITDANLGNWLQDDAEWGRRKLRQLHITIGGTYDPPTWLEEACERRGIDLQWTHGLPIGL